MLFIRLLIQSYVKRKYAKGDWAYMEPEYRDFGKLSPSCDIYSAGLTAMQVLFLVKPSQSIELFEDFREDANETVCHLVNRHAYAEWPEEIVTDLVDFFSRSLHK